MNYVFVSYHYSANFHTPQAWVKRIEIYGGIMEALAKENTVHYLKQIDYQGDYLHNGVCYHFVNFNPKEKYFPRKMNRFIKSFHPDIVVVGGLHLPLQVIQLRLNLDRHTRIIAHHHAEKPFPGLKKHIQRLADKYIDAYLFASRHMGMDWVAKGNLASPEKIHEVMEVSSTFYLIEKSIAKRKTGITGDPAFLWVGRLNDNKDPINVVRAFLKFAKNNATARLYMIYHTDELLPQINLLLGSSSNKSAVILIGEVPHDDLLYWYNSVNFIISGSHYEGSGTAICEAMSCGCIPVVTDIFSFRMITDNGKCGILYEAGNEDALLSALNSIENQDLTALKNRSLEYFNTNLSFKAIAAQIQEVAGSL